MKKRRASLFVESLIAIAATVVLMASMYALFNQVTRGYVRSWDWEYKLFENQQLLEEQFLEERFKALQGVETSITITLDNGEKTLKGAFISVSSTHITLETFIATEVLDN